MPSQQRYGLDTFITESNSLNLSLKEQKLSSQKVRNLTSNRDVSSTPTFRDQPTLSVHTTTKNLTRPPNPPRHPPFRSTSR